MNSNDILHWDASIYSVEDKREKCSLIGWFVKNPQQVCSGFGGAHHKDNLVFSYQSNQFKASLIALTSDSCDSSLEDSAFASWALRKPESFFHLNVRLKPSSQHLTAGCGRSSLGLRSFEKPWKAMISICQTVKDHRDCNQQTTSVFDGTDTKTTFFLFILDLVKHSTCTGPA